MFSCCLSCSARSASMPPSPAVPARQTLTADPKPPDVSGVGGTASQHDVRKYGAKGDGTMQDTAAVQAAIDAANSAGGGTVLVPPGKYAVARIELRSNVALRLNKGATLLGSTERKDYASGPSVVVLAAGPTISPSRAKARSTARRPPTTALAGARHSAGVPYESRAAGKMPRRDVSRRDSAE